MIRPSRRDVLGAGTFTLLTGIAAAAIAKPDAAMQRAQLVLTSDVALLALADQFLALQARIDFIDGDESTNHQEELDDLIDQQVPLLSDMHGLKATTLAGHRARARVLLGWYKLGKDGDFEAEVSWIQVGPLFRDLIGEAA